MRFEKFERSPTIGGGHAFRLTDCRYSVLAKVYLTLEEARQIRFILNNEFKDDPPPPEPKTIEEVEEELIVHPCPICKISMEGTGDMVAGIEMVKCPKCLFVCRGF